MGFQRDMPKIKTVIFDVDDTIYPLSSGLQQACSKNIQDFMVETLGVPREKVVEENVRMYKAHGTSMAGLAAEGYVFDLDHYHSVAHGRLPYQNLKPDPVLRSILLSMEQRKMIFSNADDIHIAKVLKILGIEDCFEKIISFESVMNWVPPGTQQPAAASAGVQLTPPVVAPANEVVVMRQPEMVEATGCMCAVQSLLPRAWAVGGDRSNRGGSKKQPDAPAAAPPPVPEGGPPPPKTMPRIVCKPGLEAFQRAIQIAGCDPETTMFFDDSIRNIKGAKDAGLQTCLVGKSELCDGADFVVESLHNLHVAIPTLWEEPPKESFNDIPVPTSPIAVAAA